MTCNHSIGDPRTDAIWNEVNGVWVCGRCGSTLSEVALPKSPSGIRLFHHLAFPDNYGWPTHEQLAEGIREVEDEMPPTFDLRINRDGVFMSLGVAIWFLILVEVALLIALFR